MHRRKFFGVAVLRLAAGNCIFGAEPLIVRSPHSGVRVMVSSQPELPQIKILLPEQPETERGIEIEFPEHAFGRLRDTKEVRRFFLMGSHRAEWQAQPQWIKEGNSLRYNMAFKSGVTLSATAAVEPDGVRLTYLAKNHTDLDFEEFQAPTCVKLYSEFYDLFLERTYVHHAEGFDLLASETPERLNMTKEQWLPCRYLVPFTLPAVPAERRVEQKEDGITWRHKLRRVDAPFIATVSHDGSWIAATHTFQTPNVWSNPERTCHHTDPGAPLPSRGKAQLSLKVYLWKGSLQDIWAKITRARDSKQA
jgi:hypothetical protein